MNMFIHLCVCKGVLVSIRGLLFIIILILLSFDTFLTSEFPSACAHLRPNDLCTFEIYSLFNYLFVSI